MSESIKLLVSPFDLSLENFPIGQFKHRHLSEDEAAGMIRASLKTGDLIGVPDDDVFEPFNKRELKKVEDLCAAISKVCETDLTLRSFTSITGEGDEAKGHINPLQVFAITPERPLLVVTRRHEWGRPVKGEELGFSLSKDSIEFHTFETMSADRGQSRATWASFPVHVIAYANPVFWRKAKVPFLNKSELSLSHVRHRPVY